MDTPNCQTIINKTLQNQTIFCPWTSRAPITSSTAFKHGNQKLEEQASNEILSQNKSTCQHIILNQSCFNNSKMNTNECTNTVKPPAPASYPSLQQSSSQFLHFLRLMQLFPDVHPATLHTVMVLCKSDFFCAVDKLLYAKRCKQMFTNRRNMPQTCTTSKCNRHKPYCYVQPVVTLGNNYTSNTEEGFLNANVNVQSHIVVQGYNQLSPLDASIKKMQNHSLTSDGKVLEGIVKTKSNETRKAPRSKMKTKDKLLLPSTSSTDLPPVASPKCKLPITPLSPINGIAEDLSRQSAQIEYNGSA